MDCHFRYFSLLCIDVRHLLNNTIPKFRFHPSSMFLKPFLSIINHLLNIRFTPIKGTVIRSLDKGPLPLTGRMNAIVFWFRPPSPNKSAPSLAVILVPRELNSVVKNQQSSKCCQYNVVFLLHFRTLLLSSMYQETCRYPV